MLGLIEKYFNSPARNWSHFLATTYTWFIGCSMQMRVNRTASLKILDTHHREELFDHPGLVWQRVLCLFGPRSSSRVRPNWMNSRCCVGRDKDSSEEFLFGQMFLFVTLSCIFAHKWIFFDNQVATKKIWNFTPSTRKWSNRIVFSGHSQNQQRFYSSAVSSPGSLRIRIIHIPPTHRSFTARWLGEQYSLDCYSNDNKFPPQLKAQEDDEESFLGKEENSKET